jgi:hypothetical protein
MWAHKAMYISHFETQDIQIFKIQTGGPGASSLTWVILAHLKIFLYLYEFDPLLWAQSTQFCTVLESFHIKLTFSGAVVLKKIFVPIYTRVKVIFPIVVPMTSPPSTMI